MNDSTQHLADLSESVAELMRRISKEEQFHSTVMNWPEWDAVRSQVFSACAHVAKAERAQK